MNSKLKVFISYASEDKSQAEKIYDWLLSKGLQPWMDKKNILPGENWESKIWKAIRDADFILLLLSKNSINKRGILQKEIKKSLELWQERLEDDIFIIPCRLEECEVPEKLKQFQWVNLFKDNGYDLLFSSFKEGEKRLAENSNKRFTTPVYIEKEKIEESQGSLSIKFPKIKGELTQDHQEINNRILGYILSHVHNFRKSATKGLISEHGNLSVPSYDDFFASSFNVTLFNKSYLSLRFRFYESGGAHGNSWYESFNFRLNSVIEFNLEDLFLNEPKFFEIISRFCIENLKKQAGLEEYEADDWIEKGASPEYENFKIFNITPNALLITFGSYQVGCYAWGEREVLIPFEYLIKNISKDCVFRKIYKDFKD